MMPISTLSSRAIWLREDDVDTDQMVPARFLRTSEATGLGRYLFYDRRFTADSNMAPDFLLNPPNYQGEKILIAGANFGCGSSREHAPWAFKDFGIDVILAPSFGDIFYNNCLKNALLAIVVEAEVLAILGAMDGTITVDLEEQTIVSGSSRTSFSIDPFMRFCLLRGLSQLGYISENEPSIALFEQYNDHRFKGVLGLNSDISGINLDTVCNWP